MTKRSPFWYFRTSLAIIRLAVMMYIRFPLSLRNVEDLLHERGIDVRYEAVWFRWQRFGLKFASLRRTLGVAPHLAPNPGDSLPNHVFIETHGLSTIWMPHSYGGCNQHAPEELMLIPVARQALGVMAGLCWDLGEPLAIKT